MKRFLAFLLAFLLPYGVIADATSISVEFRVDEVLFNAYAQQLFQDDDSSTPGLAKLLNGSGLQITFQDSAASLLVKLAGKELMSFNAYKDEMGIYIMSPLVQGYALYKALLSSIDDQAILPDDINWSAHEESLLSSLISWYEQLEPTITHGTFTGDAYEGGTECTLWALTDMDIAALVSDACTPELKAVVNKLLNTVGLNAEDLLNSFDELNARVADDDRYMYLFRIVRNDDGQFVGASLTIIDEISQVATLSFGMNDKSARLVVGIGLPENNYWWELTARKSQLRNITYLSGTSREWTADKSEAFSYVAESCVPLSDMDLRCTLTKSGTRYLWDGNVSTGTETRYEYLCSSSGSYIPSTGELKSKLSLGSSPYELMTVNIDVAKAAEIMPMESDIQVISASDAENNMLCEKLLNTFTSNLMIRLMKILPVDLLNTINLINLPQ